MLPPAWDIAFHKVKSPLKGKIFHIVDEIKENAMKQLMVILKKILEFEGEYGATALTM